MSIGNTSLPSFTSGISSPESWINSILDVLSFSSVRQPAQYITAVPGSIIPGQLYLVGAAGGSVATPGTIAIYLTPAVISIQGIIPPDGTVVDGWVKLSGDWVKTEFVNGSQVVLAPTTPTTITLPTTFEGICTLVNNGINTIQVNPASGRTAKGLIGTALPDGVYQIYQDANFSNMS
jgi:hypothetical protein